MKYSEQARLAADLRELADYLEEGDRGVKLPIELYSSTPTIVLASWPYVPENELGATKFAAIARTLGKCEKVYTNDYFDLTRTMKNGTVGLKFSTMRKSVCRPKVVGKKVEPVKRFVETGETKEVDIVEWECDPLLS